MRLVALDPRGLVEARGRVHRGAPAGSCPCLLQLFETELLGSLLERSTDNVRKWPAVVFHALPDADECIRIAGQILNHPREAPLVLDAAVSQTVLTFVLKAFES